MIPLQLPGREECFLDTPYTDVVEAAGKLAPQALRLAEGEGSVALFGHSLGAVLAFEIAREIESLGFPELQHLFVSGSPGPWTGREQRATGLDDEEFMVRVTEFAGYRHAAFDDPGLREILLPLLRADVAMHEDYTPLSREPLSVPVTAMRGADDELVSQEQSEQWRSATSGTFTTTEFPGGHMYVVDSAEQVLRTVARSIGNGW
ncbi:surfactin synthase thioesterase subunit [Streptomyces demainii]|uniref:Surfactin synthase thioesterase subunit n=1 Tax=Streptomyces demainii TaxID=588122 RepID=A0ABT9L6X0_9ACTN|nr:surfactin synthase thioesterase subunit [Streptomyces demainii]